MVKNVIHILSTIRPIISLSSTIFVLVHFSFVFIFVVNLILRATVKKFFFRKLLASVSEHKCPTPVSLKAKRQLMSVVWLNSAYAYSSLSIIYFCPSFGFGYRQTYPLIQVCKSHTIGLSYISML